MLLVTNICFLELIKESGFQPCKFETVVTYSSLSKIIQDKCKGAKSAEIYWRGNSRGMCDYLVSMGIKPVASVNVVQAGMKILQYYDDNSCVLIDIKKSSDKV